eukprot:CAMPEP_0170643618 /NCGR_PEP_ID=MMETSP0224-20130122/41994_1 /TAXON_ID=285029 /ORGANISM="Togula jolla, Strain CCCM 725" /LENGTH=65 /DNA_ID=CAMNT_0010974483 /DNA_START=114 /DNA_END=307 /DNA_ORIENTATION=+
MAKLEFNVSHARDRQVQTLNLLKRTCEFCQKFSVKGTVLAPHQQCDIDVQARSQWETCKEKGCRR